MGQKPYIDPPTLEAWTRAMTNSLPDLALQFRDHAIRRMKGDTRWSDHAKVAEKIMRERGIRWEDQKLPHLHSQGR
jgi:hypothetical protein